MARLMRASTPTSNTTWAAAAAAAAGGEAWRHDDGDDGGDLTGGFTGGVPFSHSQGKLHSMDWGRHSEAVVRELLSRSFGGDGAAADAPPPEADLCEADLVDFLRKE